jgi:signal transduction histidine kinase
VRSSAPVAAQQRFHRYVAVLFATTAPLVALVEVVRVLDSGSFALTRFAGPLILTSWSIWVARSKSPNSIPLVLAAMLFTGSLVLVEAWFAVDITSFDVSTTFGLMMLFAVLAGTLSIGNRFLWAGSLAVAVATWVVVVGRLSGEPIDATAVRALIAIAGVVFTTALVADLYDELSSAIGAYDRSRRLQEAVARCSEALLVHPDAFALHEAVRAVFEATDADYAYIDRTVLLGAEPGWEIVASAARGVAGAGDNWQTGRYAAIPTTYRSLSAGEASVIYTNALPENERTLYQADRILSELCVPISVGDEFRGSIGFVQYSEERKWTEDEIQTLWRAADMVGSYWRRQDDAEALRASNASKDKLLASVSHEIRTPLTAIVGLSEEIVSSHRTLGPEELAELNEIIAVQSRELAELVEDLLVASRADFGNLSIRPESIDLGEQVEQVIAGLRDSSPIHKSVVFSGGETRAWADPLRVRQIIRNLVTNALKYGGDQVVLALRQHGDAAKVLVADNGVGVSEREATLIFERYYRSAQSPTQPGSVGIGLAVSRQLAEMMGGSLTYVSGDSQHRFELALPLAEQSVESLVPEPA